MKRLLFFSVVILMLTGCRTSCVESPDGSLAVGFRLGQRGNPQYRVTQQGKEIIGWSELGLVAEKVNLSSQFAIERVTFADCDTTWETVWGEERFIRDYHREMTVYLRHLSGTRMAIRFRVFDDGIAFRYLLDGSGQLIITDEKTSYCFTDDHEAWSIPWRTEYYEGLWHKSPLSALVDTVCSPITLELSGGGYAFVHEAALYDYPAQNLYMDRGVLRTYLTPWLNSDVKAFESLPFASPWRMVILTKTLPELVASRIMLNLNEPCKIEDTSWIHPMKFLGIWWGMHIKLMTWEMGPKHGATTSNMERYLRFAQAHGIDAVLAEGWNKGWEDWSSFSFTEPYPDWDMEDLSNVSKQIGVASVGHNETGGNAAAYEEVLDSAYAYHARHGVGAIKTGYVSPVIRTVDGLQWNKGQSGVRHYRRVIETAARYGIVIDNHEPVMPTGLQRTYPNLMTQEGVRGQEWNAWSSDGGNPCEHVTVLPFTRILAGPVDYTPGVFNFDNPVMPATRVHATLVNQLALFVCFYSPLQMVCDLPEHYLAYPEAFRFIEQVPCDWERSMLVAGQVGDYCVYARQGRGSANWYIGGITDEESREVAVPLSMLDEGKSYRLSLWTDAIDADWQARPYAFDLKEYVVTSTDTLHIRMAPGGGFAAICCENQ